MTGDYTLKEIQDFVYESMLVSEAWRAEAWRDCEIYDGKQWTEEDYRKAKDAGIDPLTINRTFPVVNLLLGFRADQQERHHHRRTHPGRC